MKGWISAFMVKALIIKPFLFSILEPVSSFGDGLFYLTH